MSAPESLVLLLGVGLAGGLWLVLTGVRASRGTAFADRIAPQLRSVEVESSLLAGPEAFRAAGLLGPAARVLRTLAGDAVRRAARHAGPSAGLERRLERAGSHGSVADHRAEQLLLATAGLLAGVLLGLAAAARLGTGPGGVVLAAAAGAGAGWLLRDRLLARRITARERRMLAEFPAVAELMALSVGAGESAVGSLERVCRVADGELTAEFRAVLARTRSGAGLGEALQEFAARTPVAPVGRFVDGIVVALERGTPLADVLRAQAQDVRDHDKRELMEAAGRKEIAMMVPLVFFVLPLTVVFAVYPGIALLELGF
ncbi:pilus assembly protein TadB [Kocuria flava]|uniref:Pilus assembly protein TadB n=1 Tax=Kocuria flava TaxID=446860 RepID=A0A0U2XQN4_9MICC|nr:type II secretion system F family protein [Kocuria flava]ALU40514.1 pilus assembly protein TadB [Kocuria flava]GEO92443.1 pilus assembly protein TadB [Kocuria flava]